MSKDIYMAVFDEIYYDLLEAGETEEQAMLKAEMMAYDKYRVRHVGKADFARMKHKDRK